MLTLHPEFDTDTKTWFVAYANQTFEAPTLRELRNQFLEVQFVHYYPDGYRTQFRIITDPLQRKSERTPVVVRSVQRQADAAKKAHKANKALERQKREYDEVQALVMAETAIQAAPKVSHMDVVGEQVLDLNAQGLRRDEIMAKTGLPLAKVHYHLMVGRKRRDPRTKRQVKKHIKRLWTASDDAQLRQMVSQGMFKRVIAKQLGRTHNAVIGRCDRLGVRYERKRPQTDESLPAMA